MDVSPIETIAVRIEERRAEEGGDLWIVEREGGLQHRAGEGEGAAQRRRLFGHGQVSVAIEGYAVADLAVESVEGLCCADRWEDALNNLCAASYQYCIPRV